MSLTEKRCSSENYKALKKFQSRKLWVRPGKSLRALRSMRGAYPKAQSLRTDSSISQFQTWAMLETSHFLQNRYISYTRKKSGGTKVEILRRRNCSYANRQWRSAAIYPRAWFTTTMYRLMTQACWISRKLLRNPKSGLRSATDNLSSPTLWT